MDIKLRDVDYFLAWARHGGLAPAAETLNVGAATVVKAIQRLEESFDIELLQPESREARLTPWALNFAEAVQGLSARYADALRVISEMKGQRTSVFRIGFPDPGRARPMAGPLSMLLQASPGLRLKIRMGQPDRLMAQAVRDGDLDIAMMPVYEAVPEGCDSVEVGRDPLLPVVRAGHPLAQKASLLLADLVPYAWSLAAAHAPITLWLNEAYARSGLAAPEIAVENEYASLFSLSLLRANDLITVIPRSVLALAAPGEFRVLPLPALRRQRSIVFLTRAQATQSPLLRSFLDAMVQAAATLPIPPAQPWEEGLDPPPRS